MKNKLLFVYGFGGSPESTFCRLLREHLPVGEFEVLCPVYPQDDCHATKVFLEEFVRKNAVDLVVGTSLGGFVTLCLDVCVPKVVINPCMMPTVELPLLKPRPDHPDDKVASAEMLATYAAYEKKVNHPQDATRVTGLFATQDEYLGDRYFQSFKDAYGDARRIPGGHHGNKAAMPKLCEAIIQALDNEKDG